MKASIMLASLLGASAVLGTAAATAAPTVAVRLPERFRLLTSQLFDLRVEATTLSDTNATIRVLADGQDITASLGTPEVSTNNDANTADNDKAWTFRNVSFATAGVKSLVAEVTDTTGPATFTQRIGVQTFSFDTRAGALPRKNIILYIGDAMGTAYRDSGRLVGKSTNNRFRQGFFDQLQSMDTMPASGMVMTYALDRVVPDSANTASAWCTGNKAVDGSMGVFPDNDDFRYSSANIQNTKQFVLNNPRVETLWEYLKRLYGYKTGIVSTADIADATPAGEGSHTLLRALTFDIARQFVDGNAATAGGGPGSFTTGPVFDVIMGGGMEHFNRRSATNAGDTRDLTAELQTKGFTYVTNRTDLNALPAGTSAPDRLLGLFYSTATGPAGTTTGVANTGANGNMVVAYDKLGLPRPTDEAASNSNTSNVPVFNGFNDQPFLDEMTTKAIATLSKNGGPFILMVEGASIDKQSHPNNAAGVVYDVIEFDKAIAVGRAFGTRNGGKNTDTLVLVTADHDQSMSIIGVTDSTVSGAVLNTRSQSLYPRVSGTGVPQYDPGLVNNGTPGPGVGASGVAPSNSGQSNPGEVIGFPDYADATYSGGVYPNNANRFKLSVGFRTGNHTGSSVPITADGPGALLYTGYFDQTDVFFKMAKVLSSDTTPLDEFQKLQTKFGTISPNY